MTNNSGDNNGNGNVGRFAEFAVNSFLAIIIVTMAVVGASISWFMLTWAAGMR